MRNALRVLSALSALLLIAACAASSAGRSQARGSAAVGAIEAGNLRFDALAPQPLRSGVCGMFLWARSAQEPVLVLAAFSIPTEARVRVRGRDHILRRTEAEGQASFGHFERQSFSDGRLSLVVDVTFDASGRLRDGAAIERGVIRTTDRRGEEIIIPVGGMVACEP